MAFALQHRKHLDRELSKIIRRQLRKPVRALDSGDEPASEPVVHECRKSVKKVRAVAALLENAGASLPGKDRKRLKWAARALSRLRDSAAVLETLERVRRRYPSQLAGPEYLALHRALVEIKNRQHEQAERDRVFSDVARKLARTRRSVKDWHVPSLAVSDIIDLVHDAYRRSRRSMARARQTGQSASLHRWRKAVKTLWYQLRLATPLAPGVARLVAGLKRLETELGDDHNLVILGATLRGCRELRAMPAELQRIERLSLRMRQQRRRHAFGLGHRLQARKPRTFARWLRSSAIEGTPRKAG